VADLTVWILSEVEQGGMSVAAAYSIILIAIVLAAIGLMSLWLKRTYGARQDVDLRSAAVKRKAHASRQTANQDLFAPLRLGVTNHEERPCFWN
jgi:FtsZ-interacting cell division protein ZipA